MTCHVAFSSDVGAVLFSDSQLSTDKTGYHGFQKQFVGDDFLLGGSGNSLVIEEVFKSLRDSTTGVCTVDGGTVANHIVAFLQRNVSRPAAAGTNFILICLNQSGKPRIRILYPSTFDFFISRDHFGTLGSGSELVSSAIERDRMLGLFRQPLELVDMIVAGENYLDAATKSLTVDSQFTVGVLRSKRAYLMGDVRITMQYAPPAIAAKWNSASKLYEAILAHAQQIRGEIREAQRVLSKVQVAQLDKAAVSAIEASQVSVSQNRQALHAKIESYLNWYDRLLNR